MVSRGIRDILHDFVVKQADSTAGITRARRLEIELEAHYSKCTKGYMGRHLLETV